MAVEHPEIGRTERGGQIETNVAVRGHHFKCRQVPASQILHYGQSRLGTVVVVDQYTAGRSGPTC